MADMTTIKGRIAETIYPNGKGAITAESHQALLLEMVDDINAKKADKKEVTFVDEKVTILATETESSVQNLQDELSELSERIDNLPQGEEFDAEGNYPSLHVGTADTAIDLAGRGESVPAEFGFRASGGKSIKDGRAYIKRIKGNSVVWNQTATISGLNSTFSKNGDKYVATPTSTPSIPGNMASSSGRLRLLPNCVVNHVYLYDFGFTRLSKREDIDDFTPTNMAVLIGSKSLFYDANIGEKKHINGISTAQDTSYIAVSLNDCVCEIDSPIIIDLTQMFGAGNEPTTIEEFNARVATLGVDMYAYNEGQVIHCNTESIKSVGDNAWDEEWENGSFDLTTGEKESVGAKEFIRSANKIKVIPNESYYISRVHSQMYAWLYDSDGNYIKYIGLNVSNRTFNFGPNVHYINFRIGSVTEPATTYNNDIMISLVHSGWKQDTDAGYQPYWQDILPLPIIRKYFPDGMKKAGSAHDEIRYNKASGKWEYSKGKIKSADLGQENFTYNQTTGLFNFTPTGMMLPSTFAERMSGILCSRYSISNSAATASMPDKSMMRFQDGLIYIKDSAFTDAATFKAAMAGVILYYEAAEWEWVELDEADQNFRDYYNVADFGTEQSQSSVPSANFSADIIYQFNAVDMIREHELEITELQKVIATMQAQLTSLINGGQ